MKIAKILEDRKTNNMEAVESEGGIWSDGAFEFPDGSRGSFNHDETYRDTQGVLRSHAVFESE